MGKSSTWYLVSSLACLAIFGGVSVGTTYSLFTQDKDINNHIEVSGDLNAKLYLKELKQDILDEDGLIKSNTVDLTTLKDKNGDPLTYKEGKGVDLENYTSSIFSEVKLVPTMEGSATFILSNEGDVAFNYSITKSITCYNKEGNIDTSAAIASQISWSVTPNNNVSQLVKKGQTSTITVSYKFEDDVNNNDAMSESMDLDIHFSLTSVTKE